MFRRLPAKLTAIALTLSLAPNMTFAATITVDNGADTGFGCSFREAVQTINLGQNLFNGCDLGNTPLGINDRIKIEPNTISITEGEIVISSDMSINPGGNLVSIVGNGGSGLLEINDAVVVIERLVLNGGASGSRGGGILITASSVTLKNSEVSGNSAQVEGGGIDVNSNSHLILDTSIISANYSQSDGAGVHVVQSSVTLSNSSIFDNSANSEGGAIWANSSLVSLSNTTVSNNSASIGAGIFSSNSTVTLANTTLSGNSAALSGGAVRGVGGNLNFYNTTIVKNVASTGAGGGILSNNGSVSVNNTLIAGNEAAGPSEIVLILNQGFNDGGNNLFGDMDDFIGSFSGATLDAANVIATADGNTPTLLANILAPLADNGGPTLTHALVNGSPAVDAGDNTICSTLLVNNLDQRGMSRLQDIACDIGAFEGELEPESSFFVIPLPTDKTVVFEL